MPSFQLTESFLATAVTPNISSNSTTYIYSLYVLFPTLGLYPVDDINIHKEFCAPQSNHHLGSAATELHDLSHEFLIDETVDYAECPICLQRYPQDVLPVHASECGI